MPNQIVEEIRHWVAIAGSVKDEKTGGAIANAIVRIEGQNLPLKNRTQTRADGSFYFIDLPAGEYTIHITHSYPGTRYNPEVRSVSVRNKAPNGKADFDWIALQLSRQF